MVEWVFPAPMIGVTVIDRYPTPVTDTQFSPDCKLDWWKSVCVRLNLERFQAVEGGEEALNNAIQVVTVEGVRHVEQQTRHDVAAFLTLVEYSLDPKYRHLLHVGCTSSDIVDNAHFAMLTQHSKSIADMVRTVYYAMSLKTMKNLGPTAGVTHGRVAAHTTWDHRFNVWSDTLAALETELTALSEWNLIKSPGVTGYDPARRADNGDYILSTQVIPRDYQVRWASVYLRVCLQIEAVAITLRLQNRDPNPQVKFKARGVGSSAMPMKTNPIDLEQLSGMARMARGHFAAIAENVALWEDRDISNSCVERVAVPDLARVTEYMLTKMSEVLVPLTIDFVEAKRTYLDIRAHMHEVKWAIQAALNLGPIEADRWIRNTIGEASPDQWLAIIEGAMAEEGTLRKFHDNLGVDFPF